MLATKPYSVENSSFKDELKMKLCNLSCSQRACIVCGSGMKSCNLSCSQRACTVFGSGMKSCNGSCSQRCYLEKNN